MMYWLKSVTEFCLIQVNEHFLHHKVTIFYYEKIVITQNYYFEKNKF